MQLEIQTMSGTVQYAGVNRVLYTDEYIEFDMGMIQKIKIKKFDIKKLTVMEETSYDEKNTDN